MTDDNLIRQIEAALADLKTGDQTAIDRLAAALRINAAGDDIDVGNIDHAVGIAIGRDIQQSVTVNEFPPELEARLNRILEMLESKFGADHIRVLMPYLRKLHHEARKSGLLRIFDARTHDPTFVGQQVTVDQVYTRLDTTTPVYRDEDRRIRWESMNRDLERMQRDEQTSLLSAMEAANHYDHLVILGDPGSGKSTFVKFLSLCLTGHYLEMENGWLDRLFHQGWQHDALNPVFVVLRDFAQDMGEPELHGTAQSLLDHIVRLLETSGSVQAQKTVCQILNDGDTLLILDGLDEVPAESREAVRDAVTKFKQAFDRSRIVITCRILSYANPEWRIPDTETVTLSRFDQEKIHHFVRAWYTASVARGNIEAGVAESRIDDLIQAIDEPWLADMAANPMLLTVMALVHNHRGALPRETARLYHACVEILMIQWRPEKARHLRERLGLTDETDLYRILWQIAYEAHQNAGDREGAADIPKKDVIAIAAEDHLGDDYSKAQQFCDYVEEHAGLLIGRGGDDNIRRIFAFPHRTFQEYLAGCYIADDVEFAQLIDEKAHAGPNWREVVLLSIGQMYFNKMDRNQPLLAAQYILQEEPLGNEDWQAVALAGEMLPIIGLAAVEKHKLGKKLLPQARQQLTALVNEGHLEPVERAAAGRTLAQLGDPRPGVGLKDGLPDIAWLPVSGGLIEIKGQHFTVKPFQIARYPITYVQFQAFVDDPEGWSNPTWWDKLAADDDYKRAPDEQRFKYDNHPRETVSWYDAVAFCHWLSDRLGKDIRLPTEWEWQWAAQGSDGCEYPWGDEYIPGYANIDEIGSGVGPYYLRETTAVGIYPQGGAWCGALDMSGNVWEWCLNEYDEPANVNIKSNNSRVLRGGSWDFNYGLARASYRDGDLPPNRLFDYGFRVCCGAPPSHERP